MARQDATAERHAPSHTALELPLRCPGRPPANPPCESPPQEWQKRGLVPPLHFNCRSGLRSLRKSQAEKKPGWGKTRPDASAQDGFGLPPQSAEWKPDIEKYPPELRTHVQSRLAGADALEPMQAPKGARFTGPLDAPTRSRGEELDDEQVRESFNTARTLAESVASPGKEIPGISVLSDRTLDVDGRMVDGPEGPLVLLRPDRRYPMSTDIHELAHVFDVRGHSEKAAAGSLSRKSNAVMTLVEKTGTHAAFKKFEVEKVQSEQRAGATPRRLGRLVLFFHEARKREEFFARLFVQLIAARTSDSDLVAEIRRARAEKIQPACLTDDEFDAIMPV